MNVPQLIKMANQIGAFFSTMPDRDKAVKDLAMHLKRSWEPRMRRAFLDYIENEGGVGVDDIVLDAVKTYHADLQVA